jgi:hypothetical protein
MRGNPTRSAVGQQALINLLERQLKPDTGRSNPMLMASPMTATAALQPLTQFSTDLLGT